MFRVVLPPIIRSAYTCIYSIWYLSHRYCYLPLSWKSWNRCECAVGGVRFLWAKNMDAAKDIHKVMLPIWAAFLYRQHFFVDILCFHIFCPQKPQTPRCSIVAHVFRGAAIFNSCYVCTVMRIPIVVRHNKTR
jgi:hypothetical protein